MVSNGERTGGQQCHEVVSKGRKLEVTAEVWKNGNAGLGNMMFREG